MAQLKIHIIGCFFILLFFASCKPSEESNLFEPYQLSDDVEETGQRISKRDIAPHESWILSSVKEQLNFYQNCTWSQRKILKKYHELRTQDKYTSLVEIKGGVVSIHYTDLEFKNTVQNNTKILQKAVNKYNLPDTTFILNMRDGYHYFPSPDEKCPVPIFGSAKNKYSKTLLFPDYNAVEGYEGLIAQMGQDPHPWEQKEDKAFFRGATTGPLNIYTLLTKHNWFLFPRIALAMKAKELEDVADVGITQYLNTEEDVLPFLRAYVPIKPSLNYQAQLKYKYLINIDGISCSYSRPVWILASKSVLFKQESDEVQWYYNALIAYKHYVPLSLSLDDLRQKVLWARENDRLIEGIARHGQELVQHVFTNKAIEEYVAILVNEYSSFLTY